MTRRRKIGLGFLGLIFAGVLFEQVGSRIDRARYPAPGQRIDIGRQLYLDCRGSGSPTVILDAGHRNWSPAWVLVQPRVAEFARVCSYDRAGLGESDPSPEKYAVSNAKDLQAALEKAGEHGPYVLVGHSAGGMYQRIFRERVRDQVKGLVLVDSDQPTDDADRNEIANAPDDTKAMVITTALTYSGIFRFVVQVLRVQVGPPESKDYPQEFQIRMRADLGRMARSMNDEWKLYKSAYTSVSNESLGDLPLVSIVALGYRPDDADRADWLKRHEAQARLSTRGRLVVREKSAHYLPLLEPDVVVDAIRDVVQQTR